MKKFIFYPSLLLLLFLFFKADAQTGLGVFGGLSIPNLSSGSNGTDLSNGYTSRLGADFGIDAEFKVNNLFSIQPELEYSSQGGKKDGFQALTNPQPPPALLYATYNSEAKINYLMLPVLAKLGWDFKGSPLRFYVDAGPFVSVLLSAHQVTSGNSELYADKGKTEPASQGPVPLGGTTDIKDQLHDANFGVEGNIGLQYKFKKSYLFIQGGFNYGFVEIQKVSADGTNDTGAATVSIGYSLWLGK